MINQVNLNTLATTNPLGEQSLDGLIFRRKSGAEEQANNWLCTYMHFPEGQKFSHNEELNEDAWCVLLFEPARDEEGKADMIYYQCYLGDVLKFAQNQIRANSQGVIVKKCIMGYKVLKHTIRNLRSGPTTKIIDAEAVVAGAL